MVLLISDESGLLDEKRIFRFVRLFDFLVILNLVEQLAEENNVGGSRCTCTILLKLFYKLLEEVQAFVGADIALVESHEASDWFIDQLFAVLVRGSEDTPEQVDDFRFLFLWASEGDIVGEQLELQLTELLPRIPTILADFGDLLHDEIKVLLFKIVSVLQDFEDFDPQVWLSCERPEFRHEVKV